MSNVAEQLCALLPPVAYDPQGPRLVAATEAEGAALEATMTAAQAALEGVWPLTTETDLAAWERVYALTSPPNATEAQRLAAVLAAIRDRGGSSFPYFIQRAAALGVAITIDAFPPARADQARAGDAIHGGDWPVAWRISLPVGVDATAVRQFARTRKPSASAVVFGVADAALDAELRAADALFYFAHYVMPTRVTP